MTPTELLNQSMEDAGMDRYQLADITGINFETIRGWQFGKSIGDKNAYRIATVFHLDPNDLLEEKDKIDKSTLGGRVRDLRCSKYLDLNEVEAGSGIAKAMLSRIENGKTLSLSLTTVNRLATFFNIDPNYLMELMPKKEVLTKNATNLPHTKRGESKAYLSDLERIIEWKQRNLISDHEYTKLKAKIMNDL